MIRQLVESDARLTNVVEDFQSRTADTAIGVVEYIKLLESLVPSFSRVYLVLDALDEFSNNDQERADLATTLRDLTRSPGSRCQVFLTSRPAHDIEKIYDGNSKLTLAPAGEDIAAYIDLRLSQSPQCGDWFEEEEDLPSRIRDIVIAKSCEMSVQGPRYPLIRASY